MFENIEDANAEIIKLTDRIKELTQEKETSAETIKQLEERILSLQEHNQKLFLRITSAENTNKKEEETKLKSCIDFAKELKI